MENFNKPIYKYTVPLVAVPLVNLVSNTLLYILKFSDIYFSWYQAIVCIVINTLFILLNKSKHIKSVVIESALLAFIWAVISAIRSNLN